jgi:uncharacterized protein (TIGR03435 family)
LPKPIAAVILIALAAISTLCQPTPSFEVASIRLHKDSKEKADLEFSPGGERFVATNVPLSLLAMTAYGVTVPQLSWDKSASSVLSERYDIQAGAAHPVGAGDMLRMLQTLLVERFKLVVQHEMKELDVYVLVPDDGRQKRGASLRVSDAPPLNGTTPLNPYHARGTEPNGGHLVFKDETMADFAWRLSALVQLGGRVVIDETGLGDHYDFELRFKPDLPTSPLDANNGPEHALGDDPSIFTAVREQLGLRLVPKKLSIQILNVERAERAAEN